MLHAEAAPLAARTADEEPAVGVPRIAHDRGVDRVHIFGVALEELDEPTRAVEENARDVVGAVVADGGGLNGPEVRFGIGEAGGADIHELDELCRHRARYRFNGTRAQPVVRDVSRSWCPVGDAGSGNLHFSDIELGAMYQKIKNAEMSTLDPHDESC